MAVSAEVLVLLLEATMKDDEAFLRCLLRKFPLMQRKASELTSDEQESLYPCALMSNHFYTIDCASGIEKVSFGLVALETATAKVLARECNLEEYIYWGTNADPVRVATIADIAEVLETSEKHRTPVNLLALLKEMNSAPTPMQAQVAAR